MVVLHFSCRSLKESQLKIIFFNMGVRLSSNRLKDTLCCVTAADAHTNSHYSETEQRATPCLLQGSEPTRQNQVC